MSAGRGGREKGGGERGAAKGGGERGAEKWGVEGKWDGEHLEGNLSCF